MKNTMWKKIFAVMMILVLVLGTFAGCGGNGQSEGEQAQGGAEGEDTSLQAVLDAGKLHVAISPDYAPYEYLDLATGEIKGSDVEFSKYIADKLGVEVVFEQMSFESCLAAVNTGSVDLVISCMGWKAERAESMELSEQYNSDKDIANTILIKADQEDQLKTAADFEGKKVVAQNGSAMYDKAAAELTGCEVEAVSNIADGIMMLSEGKVDGVVMALDVANSYVGNYDGLAVSEFRFATEKTGNVVGAPKGHVALIEKVNEIIAEVESEGLYVQWFNEASAEAEAQGL